MRMQLALRFDYGHKRSWVRRHGRDLTAVAGPDAVWLRTPDRGREAVAWTTMGEWLRWRLPEQVDVTGMFVDRRFVDDAGASIASTTSTPGVCRARTRHEASARTGRSPGTITGRTSQRSGIRDQQVGIDQHHAVLSL